MKKSKIFVLVKNFGGVNNEAELCPSFGEARKRFRQYTGFGYNDKYCDPESDRYEEKFSETRIYELELPPYLSVSPGRGHGRSRRLKDSGFDGFEYKGYKVKTKLVVEGHSKYRPLKLGSSHEVYGAFRSLSDSDRERFYAVLLDMKNGVIGVDMVSQGSANTSVVMPMEAFKPALLASAPSVLFVHSHPSGDPDPSMADMEITRQLVQVGEMLGVKVLDHVIIGREKFYSFADKGNL